MEGKKRAAALCCLVIIFLLPGQQQQQVAAMTKVFCECYKHCYNWCRSDGTSKSMCGYICFMNCPSFGGPGVITPTSAGICQQLSMCGMSATGIADAEGACVDDCTNSLGASHN